MKPKKLLKRWFMIAGLSTTACGQSIPTGSSVDQNSIKTTALTDEPHMQQLSGSQITIPLQKRKKGSGKKAGRWQLPDTGGNLQVMFRVSMNCPKGSQVNYLSLEVDGKDAPTVLMNTASETRSFAQNKLIEPFTVSELENLGSRVMEGKGEGIKLDLHDNSTRYSWLHKKIRLTGGCTGTRQKISKEFYARTYARILEVD